MPSAGQPSLSPQATKVLTLLHAAPDHSISMREALMEASVQSLTKRISELRGAGYVIMTRRRRNPLTGQRYARYQLNMPPAKAA